MARQVLENGVILPAEYSDDWYDDMTSNLTKLDDVIGSDSEKLSSADVGAAALSNNYNDLDNLPTIPTVNDATLTIQKNGVDVQTFSANASSNVTANITVPTKTSDLTNDSNFVDTSNSAVSSGITSTKVTDYDTHIADTDIHVTSSDKTSWNTVTSKANDSDVVHKSGNETISGEKTFNDLQIIKYGTQYKGSRNAYILPDFVAGYSGLSITTLGFAQSVKIGTFVLDANNKPSLDTSKGYVQFAVGENNNVNTCILEPKDITASSLGTSVNKWSTINGLEPSSLSLPSGNVSDVIDISSYITALDGTSNSYTVPANGWISIAVVGTAIAIVSSSWSDSRLRASSGDVRMLYPVLKNETLAISVTGTTLAYARFIPCQGNV